MEVFVSSPFGNIMNFKNTTPIRGSFTWQKRRGMVKQWLMTVRPYDGGWYNNIGLRNPGITSIKEFKHDCVYSIAAIEPTDWYMLWEYILTHSDPSKIRLELNVSCPNVDKVSLPEMALRLFLDHFENVQVKYSPLVDVKTIQNHVDHGVKTAHLSNTLPTKHGGASGIFQKEINLDTVYNIHKFVPDVRIIAGGGIYNVGDARDYWSCGATDISVSTLCFNPIKAKKVIEMIQVEAKNARL